MHVVMAGAGPPVVLLHGWPGFWFDYRNVIRLLAPSRLVLAPDFFGFGYSDVLDGDPVEIADEESFARDLIQLLDALGIDRAVIAGHDIGSAVGAAVARAAPDRVRGLVLMNPTHPFIGAKRDTPEMQREAWYQHFHLLPLAEALLDGNRKAIELYLGHLYTHWAGDARIGQRELKTIVDAYARPGAFAASLAWYRARAVRRRRLDRPAPVGVPTIALWGDRDPMRPLEHREGFELAFPLSESRVLSGVGHFVPSEAPGAVAAAVKELPAALINHSDSREVGHG